MAEILEGSNWIQTRIQKSTKGTVFSECIQLDSTQKDVHHLFKILIQIRRIFFFSLI